MAFESCKTESLWFQSPTFVRLQAYFQFQDISLCQAWATYRSRVSGMGNIRLASQGRPVRPFYAARQHLQKHKHLR